MLNIRWDDSLPKIPEKTPEEGKLEEWDRWFELVGLTEKWNKIKRIVLIDTAQGIDAALRWAQIIELTRITEKSK
jgi:hypothetical protein